MTGRPPQTPSPQRGGAHAAFKDGNGRRVAGAAVAVAVILVLLVVLGPDQDAIKARFEYYGAPGELRIMPDISIEDGADPRRQLPQSLQAPPPPSPIVVEEEPDDPRATETAPRPVEAAPSDIDPAPEVDADAESTEALVEMAAPMQTSPDYFVLRMVNPTYPLDAAESDRRQPRVFVEAAAFVGPDGKVSWVDIRATNGGPAYVRAVKEAFAQWEFSWRVDPGAGRWLLRTWYFKSPYFTPGPAFQP